MCVCVSPEPSGWAWRGYHNCSFFSLGLSSPLAVGKTPRDGDGERESESESERESESESESVCVCLRLHVNTQIINFIQLDFHGFSIIKQPKFGDPPAIFGKAPYEAPQGPRQPGPPGLLSLWTYSWVPF